MLEKQIGANFADLYGAVAGYAESKMKDLRKADAVLRKGLSYLSSKERLLGEQFRKLELIYEKFEKRVEEQTDRVHRETIQFSKQYPKISKRHSVVEYLQKENERFLDRGGHGLGQEKDFTETQKFIGGVPIYVDKDVRNKVIPRAKQKVESLMAEVKKIDRFVPLDATNFYVNGVKEARLDEARAMALESKSFFSKKPHLVLNLRYVPFSQGMELQSKKPRMFRDSDYGNEGQSTQVNTLTRTSLMGGSGYPGRQSLMSNPFINGSQGNNPFASGG